MTRDQDKPNKRRRGLLAGALAAVTAAATGLLSWRRGRKRARTSTDTNRPDPPRWIGHC